MVSATARCFGAATIVNAIATGKGAAFGIGLETEVTVELLEDSKRITAEGVECPRLFEGCVEKVLELFPEYKYGARITVPKTEVPIARGLKSSSIVANATTLATFGALAKRHGKIKMLRIDKEISIQQLMIGEDLVQDETVLGISIEASKAAGVTITGALDDTSATYFGGFCVTDNQKNNVLRKGGLESLDVIALVPEKKEYTKDFDRESPKAFSKEINCAWNLALSGDLYPAMTLNGLIYSSALGNELAIKVTRIAMKAGAIAAGLSGTGPAIVALAKKGTGNKIVEAWSKISAGEILTTQTNNEKARVIK